jgi:hypothetical protein
LTCSFWCEPKPKPTRKHTDPIPPTVLPAQPFLLPLPSRDPPFPHPSPIVALIVHDRTFCTAVTFTFIFLFSSARPSSHLEARNPPPKSQAAPPSCPARRTPSRCSARRCTPKSEIRGFSSLALEVSDANCVSDATAALRGRRVEGCCGPGSRGVSCSLPASMMRGRIWNCADTSFVVKNLVLVGFANIEIVSGIPRTLYFDLLSAPGELCCHWLHQVPPNPFIAPPCAGPSWCLILHHYLRLLPRCPAAPLTR